MYKQTTWKDHVVEFPDREIIKTNADGTSTVTKAPGEIIQQGTPQSATNFNNEEDGLQALFISVQILRQHQMQTERQYENGIAGLMSECINEVGTITLTNTKKYPFNDSQKSIALTLPRKTLNYDVEFEPTEVVPCAGDVLITEKQLNGFKIAYTGSAKSITVKYRVKGGLLV